MGPKVVLERTSRMNRASKQRGWVPDILDLESEEEGCPTAF